MKPNKDNIKQYLIIGLYVLTFFLVRSVLGYSFLVLLMVYFVITAILAAVYFSNLLAVAGNFFYATGRTGQGTVLLKKAIDLHTKSPTVYLNYAIIQVRSGNAEQAMKYLQTAQSLKPKILTDKNIRLTMGSCYWVMGDIDKAIAELETLREKYEYVNVHVLTTLGYMYFIKNDMDKALQFTQQAIEDTPNSGAAWDNMGQIRYRLGEIDEAKAAFLQAIEYKNDLADSYYHLGLIAEGHNDREMAQGYFQKASGCKISALNTVTREQVEQKLQAYPQ